MVVDFGVGWGRIARLFHDRPNLMLSADISDEALSHVQSHGVRGIPIKIREGTRRGPPACRGQRPPASAAP